MAHADMPDADNATAETGGETARLLRLAVPTMVTGLATKLLGVVDTIMVGPLGSEALAAVALGSSLVHTATVALTGFLGPITPLVAEAQGAGAPRRGGDYLWQGIWLALAGGTVLALLFTAPGLWIAALDQPPAVAWLATGYVAARAPGVLAAVLCHGHRGFLYGAGRTAPVTWVAVLANGLNAGANYVLIWGAFGLPACGVAGAGLATSLVEIFTAVATVALARRVPHADAAVPRPPSRADLATLVKLGWPLSAQHITEVGAFTVLAVLAGWLGPERLAAHHITFNLITITFMVPLGISTAACVRVAEERGRGRHAAALHVARRALALAALAMGLAGLAFVLVPGWLTGAFHAEPAVAALAAELLAVAALFQVFDGLQITAAGCLRGARETRSAFLAHLVGFWVLGMPVGWWLAFRGGFGVQGLWWGITVSLVAIGAWLARRALEVLARGTQAQGVAGV